jgi:rubredoxin
MPWRCPACQTHIRHSEIEEQPRPGQLYRCSICRLELLLDEQSGRLTVAPMRGDAPDEKDRPTR